MCSGTIPRQIGMLSALVELDLSSNFLKGKSVLSQTLSGPRFRLSDGRLGDWYSRSKVVLYCSRLQVSIYMLVQREV